MRGQSKSRKSKLVVFHEREAFIFAYYIWQLFRAASAAVSGSPSLSRKAKKIVSESDERRCRKGRCVESVCVRRNYSCERSLLDISIAKLFNHRAAYG